MIHATLNNIIKDLYVYANLYRVISRLINGRIIYRIILVFASIFSSTPFFLFLVFITSTFSGVKCSRSHISGARAKKKKTDKKKRLGEVHGWCDDIAENIRECT